MSLLFTIQVFISLIRYDISISKYQGIIIIVSQNVLDKCKKKRVIVIYSRNLKRI